MYLYDYEGGYNWTKRRVETSRKPMAKEGLMNIYR